MTEPSEVKRDSVELALLASASIVVRNGTEAEREDSEAPNFADLKDLIARNAYLPADAPATEANRNGSMDCGWLCPCHGSQYDNAGPIRKEPIPEDMALRVFQFIADTKIRIG